MTTYIKLGTFLIVAAFVLPPVVHLIWWRRRRAVVDRVRAARKTIAVSRPILQPIVEERWPPAARPYLPEVSAEIEWALDERTERDVVSPIVRERERAEALDRSWFGDVEMPTPGAVPISAAGHALQAKYGR